VPVGSDLAVQKSKGVSLNKAVALFFYCSSKVRKLLRIAFQSQTQNAGNPFSISNTERWQSIFNLKHRTLAIHFQPNR
jgi:hypothetical protein